MDTLPDDIYQRYPVLRIAEDDDEHIRSMKSELVIVLQMTPEEKAEWQIKQALEFKQWLIQSLIDEYHLNKSIKDTAQHSAHRYGGIVRTAIAEDDEETATIYIGYIRTCKELMETIDQDQRRIRREIKEARARKYGT